MDPLYYEMEVNDEGGGKLEMGSGLSSNWTELTRECLLDIFSRLSLEQRWLGPLMVCKTWMKACQDPLLNSVFDLETWFLSKPESISWWYPEFEDKVDSVLQYVVDCSEGGLKEIHVRHCTDQSISYVAERCPNLEVLRIKCCPNVKDASMAKIASNCPKLRELDISYSYGITHESLITIGINCPNMEILKRTLYSWTEHHSAPYEYLFTYPQDGDMEAGIIGRLMPQLKHLELRCSTLKPKGLDLICESCLNLEYLDLYGCGSLFVKEIIASTSSLKYAKEIKMKPDVLMEPY